MNTTIDPQEFQKKAEAVYQEAKEATIELLKNCEKGHYIGIANWDDEVENGSVRTEENGCPIDIWAIGVNEDGHLLVQAVVPDIDWHSEDDFPKGWVDVTEHPLVARHYPDIYRFVADNIEDATTKEVAENVWEESE